MLLTFTAPESSASATANTSAMAAANATFPVATARMKPKPAPFQLKTYSTMARLDSVVFAPSASPARTAEAALRMTWRVAIADGPRPFASAVVTCGA